MKLQGLKVIRNLLLMTIILFVCVLIFNTYKEQNKNEILSFEVEVLKVENELLEIEIGYADEIISEKEIMISSLEIQMQEMNSELARITDELEEFKDMNRIVMANPEDITIKSNVSQRQLSLILEGTKLEGLAEAYILAERKYNINAIHLVSLTVLESAWGESRLAINKNNISGFSAFDLNPYNDAKYFESKDECIMVTAKTLNENYVGENLISLKEINSKYASDSQWNYKIAVISKIIVRNIN